VVEDIGAWMQSLEDRLLSCFGSRLVFLGIQGSYGRGEAHDGSDIDAVVILDHVAPDDLRAYRTLLDTLPYRDRTCGFFSGLRELEHWERSDLFQLVQDTTPIIGDIGFLEDMICPEDVRRAVRIGACNIYHACGHNMVHEKSDEIPRALYKSAIFTVQAVSYLQTGVYRKRRTDLLPVLRQSERAILETACTLDGSHDGVQVNFDELSGDLLCWASDIIEEYSPDESETPMDGGGDNG